MCDYSLEMYRSRPAQQGAVYETRRFRSGSIGFTTREDDETAVCMSCDMRLALSGIPHHVQRAYDVKVDEVVTFIRLDSEAYRDGVRFDNGAKITLQQLGTHVKARVVDALTSPRKMRETVEAV